MSKTKKRVSEDFVPMEKSHKPILIVLCVIFSLYTVTLIFPFVWMFFNSFKDQQDFQYHQWEFTALDPLNYLEIFTNNNMIGMLLNSLILCIGIPTLAVFLTCCSAHCVASFRFKLNKLCYYLAISVMFIPVAGSLATTYKLMFDTRLINTHLGVILLSSSGFGFNFLLMHSVYKNISPTYAEAAELDGAGYWRTFLTIITPQASSMVIAVWILSFIGVWNNYETQYLFLNGFPTVSVGVYEISVGAEKDFDYPPLFSAILVTTAPMIILFLVFQKKIMQVSLGGGIKE